MTAATVSAPAIDTGPSTRRNAFGWFKRFARQQPLAVVGAALLAVVIATAIFADVIATHNPRDFSADVLKGPSSEHYFGTNREGKDIFSRIVHGSRVSLKVGLVTVVVSLMGGTLLALLAGYLGGVVDWVLSRLAELIIAFPAILFALTLRTSLYNDLPDSVLFLSKGEFVVIVAICIIFTPAIFRIMRGGVLEQRGAQYVEAARVMGASEVRIMARHLLPNITGLMIVLVSTTLPAAILLESSLSFLGVGVEVGTPSWGADLSGNARSFFARAPWIAIFPGLALSITVLALNVLGDGLRDALDPRLRGKI
jgi:ABC-type dipeptide/oligopeptide/nickel transport system permease subunit